MFQRYAIYYAPEHGARLEQFGCTWLKRDASGQPLKPYSELIRHARYNDWISSPARYGFHGTLKAPFRLNKDKSMVELASELETFASNQPAISAPALDLTTIGNFLALCPGGHAGPQADIDKLAESCVKHFEPFRAPLGAEDLAKRNPRQLTERQRENLEQFGYPYVLEEFRFHLTLTGPLGEHDLAQARQVLSPRVEEFSTRPFEINSICLSGDPGDGLPFKLLQRFSLV